MARSATDGRKRGQQQQQQQQVRCAGCKCLAPRTAPLCRGCGREAASEARRASAEETWDGRGSGVSCPPFFVLKDE